MIRFTVIFASFVLAYIHEILFSIDSLDGRFGNEWVFCFNLLNFTLFVDLVLHLVFYGFKAIVKLRKDYIWETVC